MELNSNVLNREIENLESEIHQLQEIKYMLVECDYRLALMSGKEKKMLEFLKSLANEECQEQQKSLEKSEFDISYIRDYSSAVKQVIDASSELLDKLDDAFALCDQYRG